MRLTDLNPRWVGAGGEGISNADGSPVPKRTGVGIIFDCPCGATRCLSIVTFSNPLDGGSPMDRVNWDRTGDTFETLTLRPSLLRHPDPDVTGCKGWHGYITNGEVTGC